MRSHRSSYIYRDRQTTSVRTFVWGVTLGLILGGAGGYWLLQKPLQASLNATRDQMVAQATQAQLCQSRVLAAPTVTMAGAPAPDLGEFAALVAPHPIISAAAAASPPAVKSAAPALLPRPLPALRKNQTAVVAAAPAAESSVTAQVKNTVWPQNWPPKPRVRPQLKQQAVVAAAPAPLALVEPTVPTPPPSKAAAAPAVAAKSAHLTPTTVRLKVGEDRTIAQGYTLQLIAVSLRKNGNFCVIAGTSLPTLRLPSGDKQRVAWQGQALTMQAKVEDRDLCSVAIAPR